MAKREWRSTSVADVTVLRASSADRLPVDRESLDLPLPAGLSRIGDGIDIQTARLSANSCVSRAAHAPLERRWSISSSRHALECAAAVICGTLKHSSIGSHCA